MEFLWHKSAISVHTHHSFKLRKLSIERFGFYIVVHLCFVSDSMSRLSFIPWETLSIPVSVYWNSSPQVVRLNGPRDSAQPYRHVQRKRKEKEKGRGVGGESVARSRGNKCSRYKQKSCFSAEEPTPPLSPTMSPSLPPHFHLISTSTSTSPSLTAQSYPPSSGLCRSSALESRPHAQCTRHNCAPDRAGRATYDSRSCWSPAGKGLVLDLHSLHDVQIGGEGFEAGIGDGVPVGGGDSDFGEGVEHVEFGQVDLRVAVDVGAVFDEHQV